MTRQATTAHPLCTCRPHVHGDGHCLGPEFIYVDRDTGEERPGACRILGNPVSPASRNACPMHGPEQREAS